MRVVLDTNVVLSRYLTPSGTTAEIYDRWRIGEFELLISEEIVAEIERVFAYDRLIAVHHLTAPVIAEAVAEIRQYAIVVRDPAPVSVIKDDPDDDKFLACALTGGAEIIVSRDKHLLSLQRFRGIEILTPRSFLTLLAAGYEEREPVK